MIQIGIVGGAGFTAGELIRLLIFHPKVSINFIHSTSNAGNKISDVHQDLLGVTHLKFTNAINPEVAVLFLCLGHGHSKQFLESNKISNATKIIDLSHDFRITDTSNFLDRKFVYGLPELHEKEIRQAQNISNPGCFATAIQLAILPLAQAKLLDSNLHVNAVTGATGAGTKLLRTTHFTWRASNFSHYKPFTHQHLGEINQTVKALQGDFNSEIAFIPNRGGFSRGIFATIYTKYKGSLEEALTLFKNYYNSAAFTFISEDELHLKQVVNTNKCIINLYKYNDKLLITSVIDNLLKGASGQAVQNMNLMCGFNERDGLQLKGSFF